MAFAPLQPTDDQAPAGSPRSQTSPDNGDVLHKFVSFFLGEKQYALPAHAVAEVVGFLTPTRLPNAPPALLGIAPLRGDILAVVDTGISATSPAQPSRQKAVVLRPNDRSVELPIAFNVDRLGEILKIGEDQIRSSTSSDPLATFESQLDDKCVLLIEPNRIQNLLSATEQ
jgi:chemotaxis signal transduction protein